MTAPSGASKSQISLPHPPQWFLHLIARKRASHVGRHDLGRSPRIDVDKATKCRHAGSFKCTNSKVTVCSVRASGVCRAKTRFAQKRLGATPKP